MVWVVLPFLALLSLSHGAPKIDTVMFAEATEGHPRHSEAAIVELSDGSLFIAWQEYRQGGTGDSDFSPNCIASKRSVDGGYTWQDYRVLIETPEGSTNCYSPSLVRMPDRSILLTYMIYHSFEKAGDKVYPPTSAFCLVSRDECKTFEPVGELWNELPVQFASSTLKVFSGGVLVQPVTRDYGSKAEGDRHEGGACVSVDGGKTWRLSQEWCRVPKRGAMEAHIESLKDSRYLMVVRTQMGSLYRSHSADQGQTWSPGESMGFRAPESCPALSRIPSTGDLLLLWNDNFEPDAYSHGGKRTPLVAAVSKDEGVTWGPMRVIENDPDHAFTNPGIAFTSSGRAVINYWTSRYHENGRMGDDRIHLKLAIADISWFYESE
ncbi:MAG: hypothetical protein AMXMBFR84_32420 [Candidatus Hydrogenedentota bacterium]